MCKLAFCKSLKDDAYDAVIEMIKHQESVVAGHSTGTAFIDKEGKPHLRKAVGKVIDFLSVYPDKPRSDCVLGHSRYASVGVINKENAHPIGLWVDKKRIGFAVHNGTWSRYVNYEYMRRQTLENKTDSALLFTIYSDMIKKYGDTHENRLRAFATMLKIVGWGNRFIFMFNDKHTIFGATDDILTYIKTKDWIGIMSFGLPETVEKNKIYSIDGMNITKHEMNPFSDYILESRPPKPVKSDYYEDSIDENETEFYNDNYNNNEKKLRQTQLRNWINIDGDKYLKTEFEFDNFTYARGYGEKLKNSGQILNYRTIKHKSNNGKVSVYVKLKR